MLLSEITREIQIRIIRDGEFESLGLLSHTARKMLVVLYDLNYLDVLKRNKNISCVVTSDPIVELIPPELSVAVSDNPQMIFYDIHKYLFKYTDFYWKDFRTEVSPDALVHEKSYIAPKNVKIGHGTIIEPGVCVLGRSLIGKNVIIRANSVIGGEGFEPKNINGKHTMIPHAGGVCIGDRVEIQSNTHIAKSVFGGFTTIGADTKIDALVHIAHNVVIGERCEIVACSLIGGSSIIEEEAYIGPNSTISSEIKVGKRAVVTLGAVVTRDVPEDTRVSGNFAIDHNKLIKFIKKLDE
ncbi:MAG: UDP-3-O-(3-hydroxymyristoyl)glucosamine N-acyltransferase [Bacteroidia bacterium]|nr:UDP-3-O-(3-hydroxymyristoyl)glucosamine N-acyltransferase [Bacteroidia bacterium]